jgi:hypothetical protein
MKRKVCAHTMFATSQKCNSAIRRPRATWAWWTAIIVVAMGSSVFAAVAEGANTQQGASAERQLQTSPATANAPKPAEPPASSTPAEKPEAKAAQKQPNTWTAAEISEARAHCDVVLRNLHAVALPHAPIHEGACGAPAPVELISIGKDPEVSLSPPAIVRCDLVEQLVGWFERDVQPLALKHLKSPIIQIENMSSYACRNAYGRKSTKLSEHALANALDIGGFVTASAKTAEVLDEWGKPQREIVAEEAERNRALKDAAAKTAEAGVAGNPAQSALPSPVASTAGAAAAGLVRSTIAEGVAPSGVSPASPIIRDASRLGGPPSKPGRAHQTTHKAAFVAARSLDNPDPEMRAFLHEAHEAACRIFGTTLGPEANSDHRNHFHVDMAPRKFSKICD